MKRPLVSILVPIYNVAPYLSQCLNSLIHQTLQDIEIVCINDGSTDNSLTIAQEFADNDLRIKAINKPNTGYGDSMNLGLKESHGEYIGILEPDDWIEENAFEKLYAAAKESHADVVKANFFRVKDDHDFAKVEEIITKEVVHPQTDRQVFQFMPAIWSAIYRRDFLVKNNIAFLPTPGASYQDLSFSFKVWTLANTAVLLPQAFVHYRIDNANSSVNNPAKVNCVVDEYAEIETFLCERGIFADFGETMNAAKFRNYHWNFQRLDAKLAKGFYRTWRTELLSAYDENLLQKSHFNKKDWLALRAIIKHPHLAYRALRLRRGFKRLLGVQ